MNELHLFAGAGGGILGGQILGHTTVCAVEIEPYCRKVLLQRQRDGILPNFPIWDEIRTFDGKPWKGLVDIVCGGFPCQDIAAAGSGLGLSGERSGLWSEMARVVGEVEPSWVFVENSPLLRRRGLFTVLRDLASMGYDAAWARVSCKDVGGFHLRDRLWILATNNRKERVSGDISETLLWKPRVPHGENGRGREDIKGRSDLPEPVLLRRGNDVANYVDRISAIGNGQVPIVAATAYRFLKEQLT